MNRIRIVATGEGRTRVDAELYEVGPDLLVVIGGEGPHIGAATLAETATSSRPRCVGLSAPGHREAELTDRVSRAVADATGRRTLAIAGIHLDRILQHEIQAIRDNVQALIPLLIG